MSSAWALTIAKPPTNRKTSGRPIKWPAKPVLISPLTPVSSVNIGVTWKRPWTYLCFSSGLSSTFQNANIAVEDLKEQFPDRTVLVVDSLCASMGEGLFCYLCAQQKAAGKSMEEVRDYAESIKLNLCHWFTVDDLNHLKRGGRISSTTALVGTMLSIKPVMHVDNEGHLIPMAKVRGRKASLTALVDHMEATAIDPQNQTIFISHGDCLEDAQFVADEIRKRMGVTDIRMNYIGPVIGSHSGPGTVALFFLGKER